MKKIILTILLLSMTAFAQQELVIKNAPGDFDVKIIAPICKEDGDQVNTTFVVYKKGQSKEFQKLEFENETMPCSEKPGGVKTVLYNKEDTFSDVIVGDFNFDGKMDLALRDGMNGGYGFPSFQIYLFSKKTNKFVHSPSFSELGQFQGMFEVNKKKKMIYNHSKSGYGFYQTEGYKIVNNKPFKVYEHTFDGLRPDGVENPLITTKKRINGKWRTWNRSSARRISFARGKTGRTMTVNLTKNEPIKWFKVGAAKGQILSIKKDSADVDVSLVDFKGDVSSYESSIDMEKNDTLFAKLLGTGDYFVEVSAEKNVNVSLTITIEKDDGSIQFPNFDTDETGINKDAVKDEDKTTIPRSKDDKLPDNLITSTSVGKIKLGMTIAEARKVLKGYEFSRTYIGYRDLAISVQKGGKEVLKLDAGEGEDPDTGDGNPIKENLKIVGIEVFDSRYKTAEGVHPKITIAEAEKRYGKIKKIDRTDETPEFATFTDHPKGFYFSLEGKKGPGDKDNGYYLAGIYGENNYETNRYKPDAFISSITISTETQENQTDADSADVDQLITSTSVGYVKLGMTIGEAKKVLPKGLKLAPAPGDEGTTLIGVYEGDKLLFTIGSYEDDSRGEEKLPPINEAQKIEIMLIMDSRFKTAEGIHIGLPIAEAEKKYGKLKEMFNYPHEGEFGKFENQPKQMNFYFRPKGDKYEAGIYEAVPNCPEDAYPPSCRVAKKYNPGSYIFEMSISLPPPAQRIVSIEGVPENFKIQIYGPTECEDEEGKTTYSLWTTKGSITNYQGFEFEGLMGCPEEGEDSENVTVAYKDQFDVYFGDYNFDGLTDLALRDGMNGGYGFPSYQVYLFSKEKDEFVLSPSFTELGQYQGMFEVNEKRKMIYNHTKSGCCSHTTEGYKIVNNKPFKVYDHTVEGFVEVADGVTTPEVITKKLVNGKWRNWDIKSASKVSFDRGKSSKTMTVSLNKNEPVKWLKLGASKGQMIKATVDSADADVRLVDFRGDVSFYDSYEPVTEGEDLPAKLMGTGDYYLEISAEENMDVRLTITIENDTSM